MFETRRYKAASRELLVPESEVTIRFAPKRGRFIAPMFVLTSIGFLLAGTSIQSFAQDVGSPSAQVQTKSALEMIKHGGIPLLILGVCSIVTLTLIIERFMFYRTAVGKSEELVARIKGASTLSDALATIENTPGVAARVFRLAIRSARDGRSPEHIEQLVQGEVTKELIAMERFLPQLDTMVTMCPLIGLAGTTLGMIRSFSIVAAIGMSDPTKLAGGISEALVNTAAGLLVAIPALFCYNYFTGKKEAILMDLEKGLSELMVILKTSPSPQR